MKILKFGKLKIKDCKGLASVRGLMFDSLKDKDGALIYANNIWTPFCVPLDLYFLDKNYKVTSRVRADPWQMFKDKKAKYCLELKRGARGPKIGQKVNFL